MTRILIIEDSPTQAEQLLLILEDAGYDVDHAADGQIALERFAAEPYSAVISDIMMPNMTGYDFCREMKKHPKGRETPVILLSTLSDPMDIIRGLECGADNFVTKPYEPEQLLARVKTVLQNREMRGGIGKVSFGVEVMFLGKTFVISSEKEQILDLLIATFEDIVRTNRGLQESKAALTAAKQEIESYAHELERRVAERTAELLEQQQQLLQAQKMEAVGQLTGGIAHDFNNLLTIIIGNVEAFASVFDGEPRAKEFADMALKASLRGADLTRQLLAFSRQQRLQPRVIDLNELVKGVTSLLRRTIGTNIEIRTELDDDLWLAEVDAAQVESALVNLAVNARDAMPGGGQLTIETANKVLDSPYAETVGIAAGSYAMLAVTDTGAGIPPAILNRVFDPFFTTKEVGKGTGLGLSMVYGFAKQSGGHVKIYSEEGHGTAVRLYLPRARQDAVAPNAADEPDGTRLTGNGECILVVEDNEDVRALVTRHLDELGYRVLLAGNAAEALKVVESPEKLDMLFTDVVMPGKVTCEDLVKRAREVRPNLAVLLTSGFSEAAMQGTLLANNQNALLSKPYRKQDLALKVREILRSA
jgi:signal transduction histidine kinase